VREREEREREERRGRERELVIEIGRERVLVGERE
jgi:hypothetical protein